MNTAPPAAPPKVGPGPEPEPTPKPTLWRSVRAAPLAALIIAVNVAVFAIAESGGDTTKIPTLLRFGASWRQLVWQGESWRLATAMFLHIGVMHLVLNSWYGFRLSAQAERELGPWKFLALYLVSGVTASAVSVIGHDVVSAGASGALFGLIGWRLMTLRSMAGSFKAMIAIPALRQELIWIGAWFVIGAFLGFDNYAHAGGLLFGALFAWMLAAPPGRRRARLAVTVAAAVVLVALSLRPLPFVHATAYALAQARRARADPKAVLALTEPLLDSEQRTNALDLRSRAYLDLGQYADAKTAADEVIAQDRAYAPAYAVRGQARFHLHDLAGAEADFEKAAALDPSPWTRDLLARFGKAREGR